MASYLRQGGGTGNKQIVRAGVHLSGRAGFASMGPDLDLRQDTTQRYPLLGSTNNKTPDNDMKR